MHRLYLPWPGAKEICHVAKRKEICHGAYSKNNAMICKIHLSCSMKVNCHGPNVAEVSSSVLFLCLNRQQTFYSFCVCTDLLNYWWFFVGWPIISGMEAHISWADFCPYESRGPYGLWLGFVSDHCVVMILQVPREALEFAGMSINFCSGKFGYSICPIFSKGHAEIFREF